MFEELYNLYKCKLCDNNLIISEKKNSIIYHYNNRKFIVNYSCICLNSYIMISIFRNNYIINDSSNVLVMNNINTKIAFKNLFLYYFSDINYIRNKNKILILNIDNDYYRLNDYNIFTKYIREYLLLPDIIFKNKTLIELLLIYPNYNLDLFYNKKTHEYISLDNNLSKNPLIKHYERNNKMLLEINGITENMINNNKIQLFFKVSPKKLLNPNNLNKYIVVSI